MKTIDGFLADLRGLGVTVWVDPGAPDRLKLRAPEGVLSPALCDAIAERKSELLALLGAAAAPITALPPQPHYALSPAQRRLWVLSQFPHGAAAYHIPLHQRLDGPLDGAALARAFDALVARHDSLRTTFTVVDGEPRQCVHATLAVPLGRLSLDHLRLAPDAGPEAIARELRRLGREQVETPFDLTTGPLLRACLVETRPQQHVLLLTLHHIIADGVSIAVLARDLSQLYRHACAGSPHGLPALEFGYAAYAAWQNRQQHAPDMQAHSRYWRESLAGDLPVLDLPADHPRPPRPSHRGSEIAFTLGPCPLAELQAYCAAHHASLFMGLHAVLKVLLARYSGQQDIVVGTVVAGREHASLADQVGCYLNTLALRSTVRAGQPFEAFFAEVVAQTRQAFDHQAYPFDQLVDELALRRDPSRAPLFDVMLVLQSQDEPGLALGGLQAQAAFEHPGTSKFDLTFCFKSLPSGLRLAIEYATDLYDEPRIRRMGGHFLRLIQSVLADPATPIGQLDLLTAAERRQLLDEFNDTAAPLPPQTVVDLLRDRARATPDATALTCGDRSLSHAQLDRRASRLAARLRRLGAGPGSVVGLHVARSPELVIGLLGILKAGAAYVPLDPAFPAERLGHIVADAGLHLLVVHGTRPALPTPVPLTCIDVADPDAPPQAGQRPAARHPATPADLAYVIYTSGSTGRPKGVEIPHRALLNCLAAMARRPGLGERDVLLAVTTVSFDIATLELLLPLLVGARLVLATEAEASDGARLAALMQRCGATAMQATPATWQMLLAAGWAGAPGLKLLCGGEALPGGLGRQLLARAESVWNLYGPTETTIWSTCHELRHDPSTPADAAVPIGRPIANTQVYVLDAALRPVPLGLPGDLYIGGDGLARGYRGQPALSAERFIPSPFAGPPGQRLYRTGDTARWREGGELEFLGRTDQQVKLRGFRIELGEIEAVLAGHPALRQAVAGVHTDATGDRQLAAWVVPREGGATASSALLAAELREHLRQRLPGYMVPARFVRLAALPTTPNGKIDRRALPAPDALPDAAEATDEPPCSAWECRLAGLWQQVLGLRAVGRRTDFFAAGGHSLKAAALAARVQQETGVALSLVDVFEAPTLAALAARCKTRTEASPQPTPRATGPSPATGDPLSQAQRRLWIVEQMSDGSAAYNLPVAVWLDGALEIDALRAALDALVLRHESLRTTFRAVDGEPRQFVHAGWAWGERLALLDTSADPDPEAAARRIAAAHATQHLDLAAGPLLRVALVRTAPQRHLLLVNLHHIVADLASMDVLVRELSLCYDACVAGPAPVLPVLPLQYRDHAAREQARLAAGDAARHRAHWQAALTPAPEPLDLPADFPRPPLKTWAGRIFRTRLGKATTARLRACALQQAMTPFMVLTAAVSVLLHRLAGADDIVVGVPLAGRDHADLAGQVGCFVNTVALRTRVQPDDRFDAVLQRMRRRMLDAYQHQAYPFDRLVEELGLPRDMSRSPLFDVTVGLTHAGAGVLRLGAAKATACDTGYAAAKFDLSFEFHDAGDSFGLELTYARDLFEPARIQRLAAQFERLLGAATARPDTPVGRLPLLSPAEAHRLRVGFNRSAQPLEAGLTVLDLFRRAAAATPDAPALRCAGQAHTYAQLAREVDRIAALLAAHGVRTGTRVGLCMSAAPELPAGLLGILAAGGVYVPLDPANPPARLQVMVQDAGVALVLTQPERMAQLAGCPVLAHDASAPHAACEPPGAYAYAIFTSGSTGRPKAALLPHRGLANVALEQRRLFAPGPGDRVLQFAAPGFDASVFEIVLALCHGATLCLAPREAMLPGAALQALLTAERISMALLPPSALAALPEDATLPALRLVAVGGEACPPEVMRRWAPGRTFYNLYGPTEATIFATAARCDAGTAEPTTVLTIGRPIANTRVHLLDRQRQLVPLGVPGELCIAGAGLAEGYIGEPERTAERFVPDPFDRTPGARLYRSGDLARWRADGTLEYLGRIDQQVKLRGYRIEPGEIEAVLGGHAQVRDAVVLVRDDGPSNRHLVAFVTPRDAAAPPQPAELRRFLRERLPEYMVPARVVPVAAWPMTANQKIDRRALLADHDGSTAGPATVAPRDDLERSLAACFAETLRVAPERVGAEDNFFELGGDSLLATRIVSRLRDTFRSDIGIPQLFRAGNVRALAEAVRASLPAGRADAVATAWRRLQALSAEERQALAARRAEAPPTALHTEP